MEATLRFAPGDWPVAGRKPLFFNGLGAVSYRLGVAEIRSVAGVVRVKIGFRPSFSLDDSRDSAVQ